MKLVNSVKACVYRYQKKHFDRTSYGRNLQKLHNIHKGEKCIIVCNGPSIRPEDLTKIQNQQIATFGMNRIYNVFDKTQWRPTYYCTEDILIIRGMEKIIEEMPSRKKFVPINLKWFENLQIKNVDYFYLDYQGKQKDRFYLPLNIPKAVRCKGTVTTTCIQFAIHMGFSEIYLIGADHNYSKIIDVNGNLVEDKNVKDYFTEDYDTDIKDQVVHDMRASTRAYADVEQLSRNMGTFRVYNATRGGHLEVFERVDLDKLLEV